MVKLIMSSGCDYTKVLRTEIDTIMKYDGTGHQ